MVEKAVQYSHNVIHLRMPPSRSGTLMEGGARAYGDMMTTGTRDSYENLIQVAKAGLAAITVVAVSWALGYWFLLAFGHLFAQ